MDGSATATPSQPNINSGKRKKTNHFVLVLFVFFLFIPLMAEKEIVLRVFYQLCSFGCQLCLSLLFNIYLYAEWNVSNKTKREKKRTQAKVDENFICAMRDTFWMFSIGLSSEIVNAVNIVIAFCAIMWPSLPFIGFRVSHFHLALFHPLILMSVRAHS